MKLEQVLGIQISSIPNFKGINQPLTGENIFEYYKQFYRHADINTYNEPRFQNKFKDVCKNQEQYDALTYTSKQISDMSQVYFDLK